MSNYPNHDDRALLDLVEQHVGDDFVREFQSRALHRVMEAEVGEITCTGKGDGKKAGKRTRTKLGKDKERDILKDQIEKLNRMIG